MGTYSSLTNKFQQIAGQTLTAACSNVVITDQLSEYVDVTNNSKLRVKVAERNAAGVYSDKYSQDFALNVTGNNAKVTVDGETIATVSYNATTKTATLDFTDSYKLKADYYYYLTITNVIPNETAFNQYAENNYSYGTTVGDVSTDEGKDGYFQQMMQIGQQQVKLHLLFNQDFSPMQRRLSLIRRKIQVRP